MVCASVRVLIVVGRDDLGAPNHVPNQSSFCYVKGRGRRFQNPFLFPCRKKKRFLESKEKGAPVRVEWSQIGIRRPGFTPPLRTSTVYGRLPRWNRGKLWSYPHFFRRLRGRASERGGAARYSLCRGARRPRRATVPPFDLVILSVSEGSVFPVSLLFCYVKGRERRILRPAASE